MIGGACDTKARAPTFSESQLQGNLMAIDPTGGHPAMDYGEHIRTYDAFIRGTMIVIVLIAVVLLGMLFFLVP
jgi:hypothetical protein